MKSDGSSGPCARPMTLDYQGAGAAQTAMAELQQFALHQELEESPVISEVTSPSSPSVVKFHEVSHQGSIFCVLSQLSVAEKEEDMSKTKTYLLTEHID